MRISDWSSDVCSSDLAADRSGQAPWHRHRDNRWRHRGLARCASTARAHRPLAGGHRCGAGRGTRGVGLIYLDTCLLIYAFERHPTHGERVQRALATESADRFAISPLVQFECRSEEHTSELHSLMRISYAVFCLKKKKTQPNIYRSSIIY